MTQTLYLVSCDSITEAGVDFGAAKRAALEHGGGYMSSIPGRGSRVACASFAFRREAERTAFLAAVMPTESNTTP